MFEAKKQAKGKQWQNKSDGLENFKKNQREKGIEWYKKKEIRSLRMLKGAGFEGLSAVWMCVKSRYNK
jgi:restriction endonuclease S subunit